MQNLSELIPYTQEMSDEMDNLLDDVVIDKWLHLLVIDDRLFDTQNLKRTAND
ncbi:hypothetical protein [Nostoc sp. TCL240-02]|uniref:hypothetical protein n=1 Tax=Nostoc sp. TCL240-02 TaxID=2572090 RepID=UPI00157F8142|nr:hypothetical protein [Nostoc sp. TCL240-02]